MSILAGHHALQTLSLQLLLLRLLAVFVICRLCSRSTPTRFWHAVPTGNFLEHYSTTALCQHSPGGVTGSSQRAVVCGMCCISLFTSWFL